MKDLERENRELYRLNSPILKDASLFFATSSTVDRRSSAPHRFPQGRWGVERSRSAELCRSLPPPTTHRCRTASPRRRYDETLKPEIARIHKENLDVYGADKVWTQLNREGERVARRTIERLIGDLGL